MPVGSLKNTLYGLALPVLGKRCRWKKTNDCALTKVLRKHHVAGACIQRFECGKLTQCYTAGYASPTMGRNPVTPETVFRTASIAKMVSALLVFRLQTLGKISVQQDVSELLGFRVRNPHHPEVPVTLAMLLSHTSSIVDSTAYFNSFSHPEKLENLLKDPETWSYQLPGTRFRYSNLAAGMVGCLLEKQFDSCLESLAQRELFEPLQVKATFDITRMQAPPADSIRVLPYARAFDASTRMAAARPLDEADPAYHYLLASGSLYVTAEALAKLTLAAWNGAAGFLNEESLRQMQQPLMGWPDQTVAMRHGMGLLKLEDAAVANRPLWGHQGFAYGAVNGVFFDESGTGFVSLNSGASERRLGHLACLNRDLIGLWLKD